MVKSVKNYFLLFIILTSLFGTVVASEDPEPPIYSAQILKPTEGFAVKAGESFPFHWIAIVPNDVTTGEQMYVTGGGNSWIQEYHEFNCFSSSVPGFPDWSKHECSVNFVVPNDAEVGDAEVGVSINSASQGFLSEQVVFVVSGKHYCVENSLGVDEEWLKS